MKNRKIITVILYIAILALAFSWMLGLFSPKLDNITYSEVIALFENKQVKSFVVDGDVMELHLHTAYKDQYILTTKLADPEGFRQDMWLTLLTQTADGTLENYHFIAEDKTLSPWDFFLPVLLAGLAILVVWVLLVGRANQNNPMANFGKVYIKCDEDEQVIVRKAVPQNISEAEPKDVSKK